MPRMACPYDAINKLISDNFLTNPVRYVLSVNVAYDGDLWCEKDTVALGRKIMLEEATLERKVRGMTAKLEFIPFGSGTWVSHARYPESVMSWMVSEALERANASLQAHVQGRSGIRSARITCLVTRCLECPP